MRNRSIPRWMRGVAAVTSAAFGWTFLVATPVQAWAQGKQAFNPLRRVLSDAEMKSIVGSAANDVPQAGTGSVNGSFVSGAVSGTELWYNGSQISQTGWTITNVSGASYQISAPGSALLGTYVLKESYTPFAHKEATFQVVQPATSLHSGNAYPWEGGSEDAICVLPGRNPFNGNKTTTVPIVGWTARGGLPVEFTLVHNSLSSNNLTLGVKWTHSYDLYLIVDASGNVTTHWGNDLSYVFTKNVNGSYSAPAGIYDSLVKNGNNTYTLTTKHKVVYEFNTSLRCTSITDRNSNSITLG